MPTFVPSPYSTPAERDAYGEPITMAILGLTSTVLPAITSGVQARKAEKEANAAAERDKWKSKYQACKEKRRAKGKGSYPDEPGRGPFYTDCREDYKKWQKWKEKAAAQKDAFATTELPYDETSTSSPWPLLLGLAAVGGLGLGAVFLLTRGGEDAEEEEVAR